MRTLGPEWALGTVPALEAVAQAHTCSESDGTHLGSHPAVTSICVPHCERSEAKPPVERGAWKEAPDSDD